ncbi:MAG: hypothetical protein EZS28_000619 [Streblomastix strix]|uniref:Uncharacterized protein n=1 Tax=Streblomastix strix TaxID=222440 RepID=A0A5J4X9P3_9EUKA|nr:MAG: hypothetical protein EZS28_000619 [Streblomastix strix]
MANETAQIKTDISKLREQQRALAFENQNVIENEKPHKLKKKFRTQPILPSQTPPNTTLPLLIYPISVPFSTNSTHIKTTIIKKEKKKHEDDYLAPIQIEDNSKTEFYKEFEFLERQRRLRERDRIARVIKDNERRELEREKKWKEEVNQWKQRRYQREQIILEEWEKERQL